MMGKRGKIVGAAFFTLATAILVGGIVVIVVLPSVVHKRIKHDAALTNGSFAEPLWQDPPFAITMQFWIFNVTNPDKILDGEKPILVQKGPYGFRETQRKEEIIFSENDTVSYLNRKEYFWDPTLSCKTCLETDLFTVPNIPYLTVTNMLRSAKLPSFVTSLIEGFLRSFHESPFVSNIKAHELLFDGYEDKLFNFLKHIPFVSLPVPARMGLFYGKNSTTDGLYVVETGADDIESVGRIVEWENHKDLLWTGWWRKEFHQANMINGSDGTIFPPFLERHSVPPMFIRDLCRSLYLSYESDSTYRGMNAYRFTTPPEIFSSNVPVNRGFCWPSKNRFYNESIQPKESDGWCLPDGMMDLSNCQNGAPIVVSAPQFSSCPDEVKDSVEGLYPESKEFVTFVDIEPTTGVVMNGARRLQLNVAMSTASDKSKIFKDMKSVIVPIVWINESVHIDQATFNYLYKNVVTTQRAAYIGSYAAIGLGALIMLIILVFIFYQMMKSRSSVRRVSSAPDDSANILHGSSTVTIAP